MSNEDVELEFLKLKKLAELRRSNLGKNSKSNKNFEVKLRSKLTDRAKEVLDFAEKQFPVKIKYFLEILWKLVDAGKLNTPINGYTLYELLVGFGLNVQLPTRIYVKKKGRQESLHDFLSKELK